MTGLLWSVLIHAQEAINAAGSDAKGSSGTVSYSIGQLVYSPSGSNTGSVAQGVQHVFEIQLITSVKPEEKNNLQLEVYPNPANQFIYLNKGDQSATELSLKLYDLEGRLVHQQKIIESSTHISLLDLSSGFYLLKILYKNQMVKTFKIIKKS